MAHTQRLRHSPADRETDRLTTDTRTGMPTDTPANTHMHTISGTYTQSHTHAHYNQRHILHSRSCPQPQSQHAIFRAVSRRCDLASAAMTGSKGAAKPASKQASDRAAKRKRTDLDETSAGAGVGTTAASSNSGVAGAGVVVLTTAAASGETPAGAGVALEKVGQHAPSDEISKASGSQECPAGAGHEVTARAETRLVCEEAASVLAKHSKGTQRIPLERMGISPFNRRINGPYVHKLGKRILSVEGFARLRYRSGWCHEPDPADELSVARFTNAAAAGSGLLAPVPMVPLFGSFAKSHLLSFLQALRSGQVYWDQT